MKKEAKNSGENYFVDDFLTGEHPGRLAEKDALKLGRAVNEESIGFGYGDKIDLGYSTKGIGRDNHGGKKVSSRSRAEFENNVGRICQLRLGKDFSKREWKVLQYYPHRDEFLVANERTSEERTMTPENLYFGRE